MGRGSRTATKGCAAPKQALCNAVTEAHWTSSGDVEKCTTARLSRMDCYDGSKEV